MLHYSTLLSSFRFLIDKPEHFFDVLGIQRRNSFGEFIMFYTTALLLKQNSIVLCTNILRFVSMVR